MYQFMKFLIQKINAEVLISFIINWLVPCFQDLNIISIIIFKSTILVNLFIKYIVGFIDIS